MSEPWEPLRDSIVATIKERAKEFLDDNAEAKEFLADRAEDAARLAVAYKLETDEANKKSLLHELELVRQTVENEVSALALTGKEASKSLFKEIVNTAFGALVKYLPTVLAAL